MSRYLKAGHCVPQCIEGVHHILTAFHFGIREAPGTRKASGAYGFEGRIRRLVEAWVMVKETV